MKVNKFDQTFCYNLEDIYGQRTFKYSVNDYMESYEMKEIIKERDLGGNFWLSKIINYYICL